MEEKYLKEVKKQLGDGWRIWYSRKWQFQFFNKNDEHIYWNENGKMKKFYFAKKDKYGNKNLWYMVIKNPNINLKKFLNIIKNSDILERK